MLDFLTGSIKEINKHYIVLDVLGFGCIIFHSNPFLYELNKEYKVKVYLHIKEDCLTIYGFEDDKQKDLFLKLIDVNGIGPKTAMNILEAETTSNIINAINMADTTYLKSIAGIGLKLSQQIILELKGKLKTENNSSFDLIKDVKSSLRQLSFTNKEIEEALGSLDKTYQTANECIKDCLLILRR